MNSLFLKVRHMPWYHKQPPNRVEEEDQKFSPMGLKVYVLTVLSSDMLGRVVNGLDIILGLAHINRIPRKNLDEYRTALEEISNRPPEWDDYYRIWQTQATPSCKNTTFAKPLNLIVEKQCKGKQEGWFFELTAEEMKKLIGGSTAYDFDCLFTMFLYLKSRMVFKRYSSTSGAVISIPHNMICDDLGVSRATVIHQIDKLVNLGLIGRITGTDGESNTYSCPPNDLLMQLNAGEIREKHRKSKKYGGVC